MSETEARDDLPSQAAAATASAKGADSTKAAGGRRKCVVGEVVSDRMDKTISVRVQRLEKHRQYGKFVRRNTTLKAHDESERAKIGDVVRVEETRPLSKSKRWRLVEVVRRSTRATIGGAMQPTSESAGS